MSNRINDPIQVGSTPTDNKGLSQTKEQDKLTFGLEAAETGGKVQTGTGIQRPVTPEYSSFKKYLPGTEGIYAPEETWQTERALRQGNLAQAGNALGRTLVNVIPETIKQASRMLDFSGDYESDNFLGKAMTDFQTKVNEVMPIFRENPNQAMDFGDFALS